MAFHKTYPKSGKKCKVTFELAKEASVGAKKVALVGDFNDWSETATMMKKNEDGFFSVTIQLEQHREYQFRYLIDGCRWENDWDADKYVPSLGYNVDNSVIIV